MTIFDRYFRFYGVNIEERSDLIDQLTTLGIPYFVLDGRNVNDSKTFFAEAARTLPLDPPLLGTKRNWDAFTDSVFGGLDLLAQSRVVFILDNADRIIEESLMDLITICLVMHEAIMKVMRTSTNITVPVRLAFILLGSAQGFSSVPNLMEDN